MTAAPYRMERVHPGAPARVVADRLLLPLAPARAAAILSTAAHGPNEES
jgi:hypothetical protein